MTEWNLAMRKPIIITFPIDCQTTLEEIQQHREYLKKRYAGQQIFDFYISDYPLEDVSISEILEGEYVEFLISYIR